MIFLFILSMLMLAVGILMILFSIIKKSNEDHLQCMIDTDDRGILKNVCPVCGLNLSENTTQCPKCGTIIQNKEM